MESIYEKCLDAYIQCDDPAEFKDIYEIVAGLTPETLTLFIQILIDNRIKIISNVLASRDDNLMTETPARSPRKEGPQAFQWTETNMTQGQHIAFSKHCKYFFITYTWEILDKVCDCLLCLDDLNHHSNESAIITSTNAMRVLRIITGTPRIIINKSMHFYKNMMPHRPISSLLQIMPDPRKLTLWLWKSLYCCQISHLI